MNALDGTKRPLGPLNKLQRVVLGGHARLSRADCTELINWISSVEDELLTARDQIAGHVGRKTRGVHAAPDELKHLYRMAS